MNWQIQHFKKCRRLLSEVQSETYYIFPQSPEQSHVLNKLVISLPNLISDIDDVLAKNISSESS